MISHNLSYTESLLTLSEELLDYAVVAEKDSITLGSGAVQASALISRQALEELVNFLWDRTQSSEMKNTTMRTQLLCLKEVIGDYQAQKSRSTWIQLSCGIHKKTFQGKLSRTEVSACNETIKELASTIQNLLTDEIVDRE